MRIPHLIWLAVFLAGPLHAQQPDAPTASPPLLPSPPYVKSPPDTAQWLITYSQGNAGTKTAATTPPKNKAPEFAKKTVVVTKNPGIISETTALQNGAVTRKFRTPMLSVVQLGSGEWIPCGGENSFNETDYAAHSFAGFDWLAENNYVGVQKVANHLCFVFHDKVVTSEPGELQLIHASMEAATQEWNATTYEARHQKASSLPRDKPDKQKSPGASATPKPIPTPPPAFDANSYKRDVTAYIDVETGLPFMLTYETGNHVPETRVYTFMPPPTTPVTLPPETRPLFDNLQARRRRAASPVAVP